MCLQILHEVSYIDRSIIKNMATVRHLIVTRDKFDIESVHLLVLNNFSSSKIMAAKIITILFDIKFTLSTSDTNIAGKETCYKEAVLLTRSICQVCIDTRRCVIAKQSQAF
jgi:hypothetical protein